jgi:hypothetical protein
VFFGDWGPSPQRPHGDKLTTKDARNDKFEPDRHKFCVLPPLEALANPTGICISEDLAHKIQNKIEESIVKLGPSTLKNIHTPVDIYKIML